jgi:transposase
LRFILTAGQASDMPQAKPLIAGFTYEYGIGDKGYDSDAIVDAMETSGAIAVIPPKCNRKEQRYYDKHIYKERHLIEVLFNKLKQHRRIATRYDKTAACYLGFVYLAAALLWLK